MGKLSKKSSSTSTPQFANGYVTVNGRNVASAVKNGDNVVSTYNMNENEKRIQNSVQSGLASSLDNLFSISDNQRQEWSNQLDAIKSKGIDEINDIYKPMETDLKNDIANRFGNLDNSIFMDNLNSITDKKAKAVADLSREITSTQDELYNNEITKRMATISFLNDLNNDINNTTMNFLNAASANNKTVPTETTTSSGSNLGNVLSGVGKMVLSYYTKGIL